MATKIAKGDIEKGGFALLLLLVTIGLALVSWQFLIPILWAAMAAIMFQPLFCWFLARRPGHKNTAALATLLVITVAVIIPIFFLGGLIFDQAMSVVYAFQNGDIDIVQWFKSIVAALPTELRHSLDASGWTSMAEWQEKLQDYARQSIGVVAEQAVTIGAGVMGFVLSFGIGLYVCFFFLRDGREIGEKTIRAMPIDDNVAALLTERFLTIVRATVKGSVIVSLVQGTLGAITFSLLGIPSAILFGLLIAVGSFVPAIGPALVWAPVAIYLAASGDVWSGVMLVSSGILVIGMADNILRPVLVGRDTGIPDWMVFVTTLGGLSLLGLSGIVLGPLIAGMFIACWSVMADYRTEA